MAQCNLCKSEIAWKSVHRPTGDTRSRWEKMVPALDADGRPLKERKKNGKGRTTLRSVPSDVKHTCGPVPVPSDPLPTDERKPERVPERKPDLHVPLPEWHGTELSCGVTHPTDSWFCTRAKGHDGPHIAHMSTGRTECSRWPNVPEDESEAPYSPVPVPHAPTPAPPVPTVPWDELESRVRATMKSILDEYGIEPPPQRIEVNTGGKTYRTEPGEIVHPCVHELVGYLARRRHTYLHGPAGGGKTFGAEQACKLVGLDCAVITMPGMTYSKILGFKDAEGRDTETTLLDCFDRGKVAILDEFDRTLPAVAAALNSMLENGRFAVGTRVITRHENFAVVATGNTDLRGGTRVYTSAQPIDYATAARFAFLSWPYNQAHEESMVRSVLPCKPAKALVEWVRRMRGALTREHIDTVLCGPREAYRIAQDVGFGVPVERAAEAWIWRGLDAEIVARMVRANPYPTITKGGE